MQARFEDKILFWTTGLARFNDEIHWARQQGQRVYLDIHIVETLGNNPCERMEHKQIDITQRIKSQGTRIEYLDRYYKLWTREEGDTQSNAKAGINILLGDGREQQTIFVCTLTNKGWLPPHQTYMINKMSPVSGKVYRTTVIKTIAKRLEEIESAWRKMIPADEGEEQEINERIMLINKAKWNWLGLLEGEQQ